MAKKMIPFYVLNILEELSDENHALLPTEIVNFVNQKYGQGTIVKTETVIENIYNINKFYANIYDGVDVVQIKYYDCDKYNKNKRYFISERKFEFGQIVFLNNTVLNSNALPQKETIDLCLKLKSFLSKYQRNIISNEIITDGSIKTSNRTVYINLEIIKQAIEDKKNIIFTYNEYNLNKKLVPRKRKYPYIISPYGIICSHGSYFLIGFNIANNDKRIYRIDKITDININTEYEYVKNEKFDLAKYVNNSVFMHVSEEKIDVKLRCKSIILDQVIERFADCRLEEDKDNSENFIATILNTTYIGMKYWILEFTTACEVIEPIKLREEIKETLRQALNLYEGK